MAKQKAKKKVKTPYHNGKTMKGRFAKGNTAAKGKQSPEATHRRDLARAFTDCVSVADMLAIGKALVKKAKTGDVKAAKEVLDRCLGKAKETHEVIGAVTFMHALSEATKDGGSDG